MKTKKRGGSGTNKTKRRSLLSTIGTAATDGIAKTTNFIGDKAARFFGYKRINESEEPKSSTTSNVASEASKTAATASGIVSGALNKVNQVGEIVVDTLNDNIETVKPSITGALANTVDIAKETLENVNDKLNDPRFVKEVGKAAKKTGEMMSIVLDAVEEPVNELVDKTSKIASNSASKVGKAAVDTALNVATSIPGPGAAIGFARVVDKVITAGESIVEAGAETVTDISDTFAKSTKAIKEKIAEKSEIADRIQNKISNFDKSDKVDKILKDIKNKKIANAKAVAAAGGGGGGGGGKVSRKIRNTKRKLSRKLH
jgi:hypothetical protein